MTRIGRRVFEALDWFRAKPLKRYFATVTESSPPKDFVVGDELFVVKNGNLNKWVFLRCPCGCGDLLNLSLAPDKRPRWVVMIDRFSRPTIRPSVRREEGCYSHFWIRRGVVEWCRDTGQRSPNRSKLI